MNYDDVIEYLGAISPYQFRVFFLTCLPIFSGAVMVLITVFILRSPNHRCAIPGYENDTYKVQSESHLRLIERVLPWKPEKHVSFINDSMNEINWGDAECQVYKDRTYLNASQGMLTNQTVPCYHWVYDTEEIESSFVMDADLVCDLKLYSDHANMIFMCGALVGSFIGGFLSDKFGRKIGLLFVTIFSSSSIGIAFADSFAIFAFLRFLIGFSNSGLYSTLFVIVVELMGPRYRTHLAICTQFFWVPGMYFLDGMAYAVRDWRHLQLATSAYTVLFLFYYWLLPESPRWQISQGRIDKARETIEKMARSSGKVMPSGSFEVTEKGEQLQSTDENFADAFRSKVLLIRLIVMLVNWIVISMVYYGLTLDVELMPGSIYSNFALSSTMELVAAVACLVTLPTVGRKMTHCFAMLLGGASCLSFLVPTLICDHSPSWVSILLSNLGKLGASCAFTTIYIYTVELFPTIMRSSVLGSCTMVARLGTIAAPYVADLGTFVGGDFGKSLPYIVFGSSTIFAGLLSLVLPETLNERIPETIDEAIHTGNKKQHANNQDSAHSVQGQQIQDANEGHVNVTFEK